MLLITDIDRNFYATILVGVIGAVIIVRSFRGGNWGKLKKMVGQTSQWIITQNIIKTMQFIPESIITINLQGKIVFVNERTVKTFGWSEVELIDESISIILPKRHQHEFDIVKLSAHLTAAYIANNEPEPLQIEAEKKDCSMIPVEVSVGRWAAEENPRQLFFTLIMRDISHRRKNEQLKFVLAEEVHKISKLSLIGERLLNSGCWRWDLVNDNVEYTEGFRVIFGLKRGDIVTASDLMDCVYIEDRKIVNNAVQACQDSGKAYDIEYRVSRMNGTKDLVRCFGDAEYSPSKTVLFINGALIKIKKDVP